MSAPLGADRGRGELAIVLHAHMPYVEGFGTWPFGEEWLWEAVAGVYLPLVEALSGVPATLAFTPVLADQLETLKGEAGERFDRFMREVRAPIHEEDADGLERGGEPELAAEVRRAATDYNKAASGLAALRGDLIGAFREVERLSPLQVWAGPATHAVLPLLATDAGIRLQVETGIASHRSRFPAWDGGFWLPECAYRDGIERYLAEAGVRAFCVDQTKSVGLGALEHLEPIDTGTGAVAIPVDWELVSLVWDGADGYPTDPTYRDYHGRTVHDLKPWNIGGRPYRHFEALVLARRHAEDFVRRVVARLDSYRRERGRGGLVCFALDAELLGHWWYEGLWWLRFVVDEARRQGVALATLPDALDRHPGADRRLTPSSWAPSKDLATWDAPRVAEVAFGARDAELRTTAAASASPPGPRDALARAARELLALQASDWAFQLTHELADDYPLERVRGHLEALDVALDALKDSRPAPEPALRNLAPLLDLSPLFGI